MSPAEGIYAILNKHAFYAGGWTAYVGMPGAADNSISVVDTGGITPEAKVAIDYPTIQLLGKGNKSGNSYSILYEKMRQAKLLLHMITEDTTAFQDVFPELASCLVRGDIMTLGRDGNDRPLLSLNFTMITAPAEVGNRDF